MNTLTKAMVGTVAAGAMAVSTAAPAYARDNNDGVAAGAVRLPGALHNRRDRRHCGFVRQ